MRKVYARLIKEVNQTGEHYRIYEIDMPTSNADLYICYNSDGEIVSCFS